MPCFSHSPYEEFPDELDSPEPSESSGSSEPSESPEPSSSSDPEPGDLEEEEEPLVEDADERLR